MAKRLFAFVAAVGIGTSAIACGDGQDDPGAPGSANKTNGGDNGGVTLGPDGQPVGPDGQPLPLKMDGIYEMSNYFDLTTAGVFPDVANQTLSALSGFREHPTETIIELADAAGVPVVGQVLDVVPSLIKDYVLGYVDDHVFKALYGTVPVAQTITGILDDLASIATKFELITKLDLPAPDVDGDTPGTHKVTGVGYNWSQKHHVLNAPDIISKLTQQETAGSTIALDKRGPDIEQARLRLGEHLFSVPVGSFAVYAADELSKDKFGVANLRGALGKVVNCAAVAKDVAARCITVGTKICVGHESSVETLCSVGLDLIVGSIKANLKKLDLPLVKLKEGSGQMWDAATDGGPIDATIDRIDHGYWTAAIMVKGEEKTVLASFTGKRVGETKYPSR